MSEDSYDKDLRIEDQGLKMKDLDNYSATAAGDNNNKKNQNDAGPFLTYGPKESQRMMKNVIVISLAFMLLFTAFQAMANLQSSIHTEQGLGVYSLSVIYGALVLSSMFLPTIMIRHLTVKWSLALSMIGYSIYIAAQFYPRFYTLIPASILLGFCAAPLWSSKCTYLTHVGNQYANHVGDKSEVIIVRFFGIFFLAFQSSQIWGNLISSAILSSGENNSTRNISNEDLAKCGFNFCPAVSNGEEMGNSSLSANIEKPSLDKIYIIAGVYLICSILAEIVIALLVDPLIRYGEKEREGGSSKLSGLSLLLATFRQMKNPYQILIIPLTIWSGLEQGFILADYTQAFISCSWGVEKIGYVMICYGICDAIFSISFGPIIRRFGRIPVFVFGTGINIALIAVMIRWEPNPNESYVFFIISGLWGIADAIWQTQINAFYGVIFPQNEEAAFSNYRLWESIGFIIAFVLTNLTCIHTKLYILLGVIGFGMSGYFTIESLEFKKNKKI